MPIPVTPRPTYSEINDALDRYTQLLDRAGVPEGAAVWSCNQLAVKYDLDGIVVNEHDDPLGTIVRRHAVAAGSALRRLRLTDDDAAESALLDALKALLFGR